MTDQDPIAVLGGPEKAREFVTLAMNANWNGWGGYDSEPRSRDHAVYSLALAGIDAASQPPATDASEEEIASAIEAIEMRARYHQTAMDANGEEWLDLVKAKKHAAELFRRRPGADARLREAAQDLVDAFTEDRLSDAHSMRLRDALAASPPEEAAAGQAESVVDKELLAQGSLDALRRFINERNGDPLDKPVKIPVGRAITIIKHLDEEIAALKASAHPPSSEVAHKALDNLRARVGRKMADDADCQDEMHPCRVWEVALGWVDEAVCEARGIKLVAVSHSALPHDDDPGVRERLAQLLEPFRTTRDSRFTLADRVLAIVDGVERSPSSEAREAQIGGLMRLRKVIQNARPSPDVPDFKLDPVRADEREWFVREIDKMVDRIRSEPAAPPREDALMTLREWVWQQHEGCKPLYSDEQRVVLKQVLAKIDSLLAKPAAAS